MTAERDLNDTVPLMLRIREDLRQDLEQSAKARRLSLNQEAINRLMYVRDRKTLLVEIMRFAFGDDRLVGLLLGLGLAMGSVVNGHGRVSRIVDSNGTEVFRRPQGQPASEWIDDPATFHEVVQAAVALLEAARPEGEATHAGSLGQHRAGQAIKAMGGKSRHALMSALPAREIEAIMDLLGPLAERLISSPLAREAWEVRRPLAQQVHDALCARIAMGEWKPNAAIPSETELAREFDVSPVVVRVALDMMEAERLLTRRKGKAPEPTFAVDASEPAVEVHRDSTTGEIRRGGPPASNVLDQAPDIKPGAPIKSRVSRRKMAGIPKRVDR